MICSPFESSPHERVHVRACKCTRACTCVDDQATVGAREEAEERCLSQQPPHRAPGSQQPRRGKDQHPRSAKRGPHPEGVRA